MASSRERARAHCSCGNEGCELIDDDFLGDLVLLVPPEHRDSRAFLGVVGEELRQLLV